ncbi:MULTISPECIES: hypothetical protein [unclassified Nannocystis]|uniref:hypothetical protein n=1 Tax=Nannocystis TaxID=53 RepID=UPI0022708D3C|nr:MULTISPECIES: hypothetical protein [unclassified Nannocystis]MCY0994861.1 hypothetical protein [Nannocystis sp. ILAH1]MCY1065309.1 hypothetical protein [Nannocystis sp. RBIL2]
MVVFSIAGVQDGEKCQPYDRICQLVKLVPYAHSILADEPDYGAGFLGRGPVRVGLGSPRDERDDEERVVAEEALVAAAGAVQLRAHRVDQRLTEQVAAVRADLRDAGEALGQVRRVPR